MNNADREYNNLISDILQNGKIHENRTGTNTLSVFGRQMRFNLQEGFPLLTGKRVHMKGILHELLWFLGAVDEKYKKFEQTNIKYLVDNNINIWNEWPYQAYVKRQNELDNTFLTQDDFVNNIKTDDLFASIWGNLGPVYGKQWVNWNGSDNNNRPENDGLNQIQAAVDRLKSVPDCRRILVTALNPSDIPDMLLPPCHYGFQLKSETLSFNERIKLFNDYTTLNNLNITGMGVEDAMTHYNFPTRKLNLLWNQRSADSGLGIPYNIASYAILLMMFAQVTNHLEGDLISSLGDAHIYVNHIDQLKEQLTRDIVDLPQLKLNKKIKNIFDFRFKDFELLKYTPHSHLKMKVAV